MSTIVTANIPAEEFALKETLAAVSGVKVDIERVAAHTADSVTPYLWATGAPTEEITAALEEDSTVESAQLIEETEGTWLYRMEWVAGVDLLSFILKEMGATVIDAYAEEKWWQIRILFPEHDGISATNDFCENSDLTFRIKSVHQMNGERNGRFGLTEGQYEALRIAGEKGYYDVPREVTTRELAEELGVSHQALSERLRRGHRAFVNNAILVGPVDDELEIHGD